MTHELICSWLGLAETDWPPDHYRLLGLEPGERNTALIEQCVQQRLEAVRRYQMKYPELATEAMKRLAEAFVCLTEPDAKQQYDACLRVEKAPAPKPSTVTDTVVQNADTAKILVNKPVAEPPPPPLAAPAAVSPVAVAPPLPAKPPPLPAKPPPLPSPPLLPASGPRTPLPSRVPPLPPLPPLPAADPAPTVVVTTLSPPAAEPVAPSLSLERIDPILEAARSPEARRGLGSPRALYRRIRLTRHLLQLWEQAGKYLATPQKRLKRQAAAEELDHTLAEIVATLPRFPPRLGQAGQPGYLVVSLTHQVILETFQTLDLNQRQALSQDWLAGNQLLRAHRAFLRQELKTLRQQTFAQRLARRLRSLVEEPGVLLFLLALLTLSIAIWRTFFGSG